MHGSGSRTSSSNVVARAERDNQRIARLRRDDPRALEELMQEHAERLVRLAMLTVQRRDLAQDVVQNVFVALWHRRADLAITGSVSTYLHRAVHHQAVSVVRHERAESRVQGHIEHAYRIKPPVAWNEGESRIAATDFDTTVRMALEGMQPQVRDVFLLHRVQGMAYTEISEVLGVSVLTVRSQMSRALRQLAQVLRPDT